MEVLLAALVIVVLTAATVLLFRVIWRLLFSPAVGPFTTRRRTIVIACCLAPAAAAIAVGVLDLSDTAALAVLGPVILVSLSLGSWLLIRRP